MTDVVLVVNSGSSSIKFALYGATGGGRALVDGAISDIGGEPGFAARDPEGRDLAADGLGALRRDRHPWRPHRPPDGLARASTTRAFASSPPDTGWSMAGAISPVRS